MDNTRLLFELKKYLEYPEYIKFSAANLSHHIKIHGDIWGFTMWKAGDVSLNPHNVIKENEKLLNELYNDLINNSVTTSRPINFEAPQNVILIQGMQESIDRDINASASDLDFSGLGNSSTAEAESQTDLQAEFTDTAYARKVFSTAGSRARLNQTMKLGMLWDDSSFDATPRTIKEAGVFWNLTASLNCHARVVSTDFILNAGDLFVVQTNETQQNGTL